MNLATNHKRMILDMIVRTHAEASLDGQTLQCEILQEIEPQLIYNHWTTLDPSDPGFNFYLTHLTERGFLRLVN